MCPLYKYSELRSHPRAARGGASDVATQADHQINIKTSFALYGDQVNSNFQHTDGVILPRLADNAPIERFRGG